MKLIRRLLTVFFLLFCGVGSLLAQDDQQLAGVELQAMADTFQYSLENNRINEGSDWVNPDTARSGAVVPTRTFENVQGQPCREFVTTIIIANQEEQGYGTACRQPDGSWALDRDASASAPALTLTTRTYIDQSPVAYYAYPNGFFGSHQIYLSFGHVYRSGHLYRGRHYMDGRSFRSHNSFKVRRRVNHGSRISYRYRLHDELNYRDWDRRSRVKLKKERDHDKSNYRDRDRGHRGKHKNRRDHD